MINWNGNGNCDFREDGQLTPITINYYDKIQFNISIKRI